MPVWFWTMIVIFVFIMIMTVIDYTLGRKS